MADIITAARYNNMQAKVRSVLGNGEGQFGYGQVLQSGAVKNTAPVDNVTAQHMQKLQTDLNTTSVHQSNVNASVTSVASTDQITDVIYGEYESASDAVYNSRNSVHANRVTAESKLSSTRTAPWGGNGVTYVEPCTAVAVNESVDGTYTYTINFGLNTGTAGIAIVTGQIPDKFTLVWNGQTYTTGFHGIGSYVRPSGVLTENQRLAAAGHPSVQTEATSSDLTFNKTSSYPTTATLTVVKPIGGEYTFTPICPTGTPILLGASIAHEFSVTFPGGYQTTSSSGAVTTATGVDHRRHFFNAGGEIRFSPTITGGTGSKFADWSTILTNMGTVKFNYTTATATGSGTSYNIGNFDLTSSYQTVFQKTGSGVYAENAITIYARGSQNSNVVYFKVELSDADTGGFDETINGTVTSTISQLRPTGSYVSLITPIFQTITGLAG